MPQASLRENIEECLQYSLFGVPCSVLLEIHSIPPYFEGNALPLWVVDIH